MQPTQKETLQAQLKVLTDRKATGTVLTAAEEAQIISLTKQIDAL